MPTTIAAYAGRSIDLVAFQGAQESGEVLLVAALALDGGSGSIVTGIQKLAQRFLLELLTEKGSITYSTRGTNFMSDARLGAWRTSGDVEQSFYSALVDIRRNLILEESLTDPKDERFSSASILSVFLRDDGVSIRVQVTSLAGTKRVFIAPLPLVV